jgi:hypothetical protein
MVDDESRMKHALRGCLNALKLGTSALDMDLPPAEALEFLAHIEQAADKLVILMEQWDALPQIVRA